MTKATATPASNILNYLNNLQPSILLVQKWENSAKSLQLHPFNIDYTSRYPATAKLQEAAHKANTNPFLVAFHKASTSPEFKRCLEYVHNLPEHTQVAILKLAEHGWYFYFGLEMEELADAFSGGNIEEAENALIEHFENKLYEIEEFICNKFPHRAKLIKDAFNAHQRQEYNLAIPVLLAQTDGICKDATGRYLFMKEKGCKKSEIARPEIASYVDKIDGSSYEAALHSALTKSLPISASTKNRSDGFNALNRHLVLHGESLDYGSKINGLKAISLINYVAWILPSDSAGY